jgi:hypothetical protein
LHYFATVQNKVLGYPAVTVLESMSVPDEVNGEHYNAQLSLQWLHSQGISMSFKAINNLSNAEKSIVEYKKAVGDPPRIKFDFTLFDKPDSTSAYLYLLNTCRHVYVGHTQKPSIPQYHFGILNDVSTDGSSLGRIMRDLNTTTVYDKIVCVVDRSEGISLESTAIIALRLGFSLGERLQVREFVKDATNVVNDILVFIDPRCPSFEDIQTFCAHFFGKYLQCQAPSHLLEPVSFDTAIDIHFSNELT